MSATHTVRGDAAEVSQMVEAITDGQGAGPGDRRPWEKTETLSLGAKLLKRNGILLAFGLPHAYNYDFCFSTIFSGMNGA